MHKAGYANIIGRPNVGKSTFMNAVMKEKLAIVTPKAQTTRQRILGLWNDEEHQVVFSDTPGMLDPKYPLHEAMMKHVSQAWEDADVLLFMVEVGEKPEKYPEIVERLTKGDIPYYVLLNKIDNSDQEHLLTQLELWGSAFPGDRLVPLSAANGYNVQRTLDLVKEALPESPPYYDKEQLTDKTERFLAAEVIREKIFLNFKEEIPYSTQVQVVNFQDSEQLLKISAEIYVNRKSQKAIIIGKHGSALTRVGKQARIELQNHYGKKIHLDLYVKIKEGWRDDPGSIKRFGYLDL